jgi:hypothetical protein
MMRRMVALLLVVLALAAFGGVASAQNGSIIPFGFKDRH